MRESSLSTMSMRKGSTSKVSSQTMIWLSEHSCKNFAFRTWLMKALSEHWMLLIRQSKINWSCRISWSLSNRRSNTSCTSFTCSSFTCMYSGTCQSQQTPRFMVNPTANATKCTVAKSSAKILHCRFSMHYIACISRFLLGKLAKAYPLIASLQLLWLMRIQLQFLATLETWCVSFSRHFPSLKKSKALLTSQWARQPWTYSRLISSTCTPQIFTVQRLQMHLTIERKWEMKLRDLTR